jgi:site-specific DNA-methyltransferase (adenine-specific)
LLNRIITASSREGDTVLDPFCGCGTAVAVAHRLRRRWIGIDITHLAIALIRHRLEDQYGERIACEYDVHGVPVDLASARALAEQDRYQFQWWALELVGARPVREKKGADRGIDGCIFFFDEADASKVKKILVSVKSGHVGVAQVRDFAHVLDREQAQMGFFVTLEPPTQPMVTDVLSMGAYETPFLRTRYPRMQILTIESLLSGQKPDRPPKGLGDATFKKAPSAKGPELATKEIF